MRYALGMRKQPVIAKTITTDLGGGITKTYSSVSKIHRFYRGQHCLGYAYDTQMCWVLNRGENDEIFGNLPEIIAAIREN